MRFQDKMAKKSDRYMLDKLSEMKKKAKCANQFRVVATLDIRINDIQKRKKK